MFAKTVLYLVILLIGFILFGCFLEKNKCQEIFQTNFLQKDIRFPININDATKKYDLKFDSINVRGIPILEKDTLLIADTRDDANIYGLVFYLRGQSAKDIVTLKSTLEKKYGSKFINKPSYEHPSFQYMQINDCVYLLVDTNQYRTNEVFKEFSERKITCRVGFYYGLSERELIFTSEDGHAGIIGRGYGYVK